jgi:hypothetical protein
LHSVMPGMILPITPSKISSYRRRYSEKGIKQALCGY